MNLEVKRTVLELQAGRQAGKSATETPILIEQSIEDT